MGESRPAELERRLNLMRVVVLGGYGNFGARIYRALAADEGIEVIAAGRNPPESGARLDLNAPDFSAELVRLSPQIVVHCAGPFQGQDYRVAQAAIAAGAHYLDLADSREFVVRFAKHNDARARVGKRIALTGASTLPAFSSAVIDHLIDARARVGKRIALTGASTLPAFSSAVIDHLIKRLRSLEEIRIAIAPGQRAPRGEATIAGVLSYAGRPFQWLSGGAWRKVWGWQELRRVQFVFGARWAAACNVPDLELFPRRYTTVRTVEFRAALELGVQHAALWLAAGLRRAGLRLPIERWAGPLNRFASLMDLFGSERGGMVISLLGTRADGTLAQIEWDLTADANHGPEIPCMAAILLVRKIARGEIPERGAFPCMGFLKLEEFESEFARWSIATQTEERDV